MQPELLEKLQAITAEEQRILAGAEHIQSELYTTQLADPTDFTIDNRKLLAKGRLIEIRPHTRFVHFPMHRHNYVEVVYMCSGSTTHILNGSETLTLHTGDLLFLNQQAFHEILPAGRSDIAVNFIILPEFFDHTIFMIEQENVLRDFLMHTLSQKSSMTSFLHFSASNILPVQNLLENMIWTVFSDRTNTNTITQTTMGLLLMNLSMFAENFGLSTPEQHEQNQIFTVLRYIETHYKKGTLSEVSAAIRQPSYYVSRLLKKHMGHNFKELLQERKLQQAAYLLSCTSLTVDQIMMSVGYDNSSYFYRRFRSKYGCSPKEYRK